jgi:hypothetical protein
MRWIAICLAVTLSGCSEIPSYLVRPEHLDAVAAPATRESSGQAVKLRGGSFMPTQDAPLADGRVRVRGPGRHSTTWKVGLGVTLVGWAMAITGAAIGIAGAGRTICSDLRSCPPSDYVNEGNRMFMAGIVVGPIGDVMTLVGPAMMIAGARQAPVEVSEQ